MRLQDNMDFTTLQWVKPELDQTLSIARDALESYVEEPSNRTAMRSCAEHLHQVHGTLQMVELYGAAMVAGEMEALTLALVEDQVAKREDAFAALMRGMMQLPDYLERLSSGHRDVPVVLLPLLNDLRASRQLEALTEAVMFNPRLDTPLPDSAPGAPSASAAAAAKGQIADLRVRFQQQLLAWFRGQDPAQQLVAMRDTLQDIAARCHSVPGRRLWWIAAAVLEGLERGMLRSQTAEVRQLIGKVDRSIRQLVELGEESLAGTDADELARRLLHVVAKAEQRSPQMELLRETYALDSLLPNAMELAHARGSVSGHNRALLDSVAKAIKDDLLRVKESLDLFLRQQNADPSQLAEQGEVLERVGDTLGMLALSVPQRVVGEQRRVIDAIALGQREASEDTLLDVAGALLYVESSLDDHIQSLGAQAPDADDEAAPLLPRSEARHILGALMQEATANTERVKGAIVAFVESGWDHTTLKDSPLLMDEVAGALRMLSTPRPAALADGVGRYVANELLMDRRVPSSAHMDHLADALAALEYYLEAAREHRGGLDHILDVAEHSLGLLGYWPAPPSRLPLGAHERATAEVGRTNADATARAEPGTDPMSIPELTDAVALVEGDDLTGLFMGDTADPPPSGHDIDGMRLVETADAHDAGAAPDDPDWIEVEEEITEQRPVLDPLAADAGFQSTADGIDDEIREIFLEEMQEEIDHIEQAKTLWLADPEQLAPLTSMRRSFHTLKGSGRLVGARSLGEFAWHLEDMLNRVLDRSVEAHDGVQALIGHATAALPQLLHALTTGETPTAPLSAIMQTAAKLAAGEHTELADQLGEATETVTYTERRRVPRSEFDAAAIPTAALTGMGTDASSRSSDDTTNADATPAVIEMPVLPPVDAVLLEILRSEVAQYLQTIRIAIGRSSDELRIDDALLRAVHTLHGAIAMVDIPLLAHLLSPLESLLKRLRGAHRPLSGRGISLLGQSADVVDQVMALFDQAEPVLPDIDALIAAVTELRDGQPEPSMAHVVFDPHADEIDAYDDPAEAAGAEAAGAALDASLANALSVGREAPAATDAATVLDDERLPADATDVSDSNDVRTDEMTAAEALDTGHDPSDEPNAAAEMQPDEDDGEAPFEQTPTALQQERSSERIDDGEEGVDELGREATADALPAHAPDVEVADDRPAPPAGADFSPVELEDQSIEAGGLEAPLNTPLAGSAALAVDASEAEAMETGSEETDVPAAEICDATDEIDPSTIEADDRPDTETSGFEDTSEDATGIDATHEPAPTSEQVPSASDEQSVTKEAHAEADEIEDEIEDEDVDVDAVLVEADEPAREATSEALVPVQEHLDDDEPALAAPLDEASSMPASGHRSDDSTLEPESEPAAALWHGDVDADLLEVFTEEARELLDHADSELALWREEPAELDHVAGLQRDLHTLKGGARIAGLVPVGDLSHAIETLLEKPVSSDADQVATLIGLLELGFDKLHALVQAIAQGRGIKYPQELIDQLLHTAGAEGLVDHEEFFEQPAVALESLASAAAEAQPPRDLNLPDLLPELLPESDDERSPQEQIRVRAELLDSLVNHAGEVAIYRSRLEQQVSGYRFNLVELEQTVSRLRSQLRMLEIETEAQIIARFQVENPEAGSPTFDPLELDRFSQLQQYSRALAESVSDLVSIQNMLDELTRQSETLLIQQSRVSTELQEGLLRTRMLPFDTMVPNLRRTLRQAAQEQDKHAQLFVEGAHGEMDRNLLDRIKAPFEHMLRNAVVHGIESPEQRRAAGKSEEGAVRIRVAREATEVVIRMTDDGRGLDRDAIRQRAIDRGMLRAEARTSDDQLLSLISQPGFSTASEVTQLAGRGVGMDVVVNEIKQLGGSLAIESQPGQGTTFVLRLPFTLAVTQAILVRIGEATYAIPMTSVQGVARVTPEELAGYLGDDEPTFNHAGESYGIHDLAELLGATPSLALDEPQVPLLLTRAGDLRAAIRIDAVIGSREIVVKSVGPQISSVPGLLGATIIGDGSVLVILDLAPLVRHGLSRREARLAEGLSATAIVVVEEQRTRPLVMVVDDSITMRKVTGRVLERNEYEVSTAKDGIDAIEKLHERIPDLMLLDIEMPRMDGYELAAHMKATERLRGVPIIMITSRSGEKHRQRAYDLGVNRYLGKPYQEADLLLQIDEVLQQSARSAPHD